MGTFTRVLPDFMNQNSHLPFLKSSQLAVLAIGILFLLKAWSCFSQPHELFNASSHTQFFPTEMTLKQLPFTDLALPTFQKGTLLSTQPAMELFAIRYLGFSPLSLFIFLSLLQIAAGCAGCYLIARAFSESLWCGPYVVALVFWGWLHKSSMGYTLEWEYGMFPGMLGAAFGYLSLGFWLINRREIALILVGLLCNIHPSNAIILSVLFLIHLGVMYTNKEVNLKLVRPILWGALVAILIALPELFLISKVKLPAVSNELTPIWWRWMELRRTFHLFPWKQWFQVYQFGLLIVILVISLFSLSQAKILARDKSLKAISLIASVLFLVVFNWAGVTLFKSANVATLILTRASLFLLPVAGALVFLLGDSLIQRAGKLNFLLGFCILMANFFNLKYPRYWILPTLLYCVGALKLWWQSNKEALIPQNLSLLRYGYAFLFMYVLIFASSQERQYSQDLSTQPSSDWKSLAQLKTWAEENTSKESILLVPPAIMCSLACVGRIPLFVAADFGVSIYIRSALPLERKILRTIYNIDIMDENTKKLGLEHSGVFVDRYQKLTESELKRIKLEFPYLSYIVTTQDHTLAFPLLYKNLRYQVYAFP